MNEACVDLIRVHWRDRVSERGAGAECDRKQKIEIGFVSEKGVVFPGLLLIQYERLYLFVSVSPSSENVTLCSDFSASVIYFVCEPVETDQYSIAFEQPVD